MNHDLISVNVKIPSGTERAFKKLVAAWVEGTALAPGYGDAVPAQTSIDDLLAPAANFWRSLSLNERTIFGLWVDIAPDLIPADQMVERLGLKSTQSIRGHIRRLTDKAARAGFQAGWQSSKRDALTGHPLYGLRDFGTGEYGNDSLTLSSTEYAELLSRARRVVEQES